MEHTIDLTTTSITDFCRSYAKGRISSERLLSLSYHVLSELELDDEGKIGFLLESIDETNLEALAEACAESQWHGKRGDSFKVANIVKLNRSRTVDGLENTRVPYEFVRNLGRAIR